MTGILFLHIFLLLYTLIKHSRIIANLIISQHPFTSYAEAESDPSRIPPAFIETKWNEFNLCMQNKDNAMGGKVEIKKAYKTKQ